MSVRPPLLELLLGRVGGLFILTIATLSLACLAVLRLRSRGTTEPALDTTSRTAVRELAAWMVGATAAFALYGSLLPFNFQSLPADAVRSAFDQFPAGLRHRPSERDFFLNLTLFLPFGYGVFAWLEPRPAWNLRLLWSVVVIPIACLMVSLPAEFGQIWLPGRVCSIWDVVAHLAGTLLGAVGWLLTSRTVVDHLPGTGQRSSGGPARLVLYAYVAFLLLASLFPFDLIPNLSAIADSYRRNRIQLSLVAPTTPDELKELIFHAFCCIPLGVLAAGTCFRDGRVRFVPALLLSAALAVSVEILQLCIRSRFTQLTHAVVGSLGAWTGTGLAAYWSRLRRNPGGTPGGLPGHPLSWLGLAVLYSLFPLVFFTWPLDLSRLLNAPRLHSLHSLPFQRLHQASPLNATTLMLQKVLLYIPTGYLCATAILQARSALTRRLVGIAATAVIFAGPIAVEGLQLFLPDHTADVTDVLLGTFGGLIGCLTVQAARQGVAAPIGLCVGTGLFETRNLSPAVEFEHFVRDGASSHKRELTPSIHSGAPPAQGPPASATADPVGRCGPTAGRGSDPSTVHAVARPVGRGYPVAMSHSEYASACGMSGPLRLAVETRQGSGTSYTFTRPTVLVGRIDGCDLQLDAPEVARRHLLLQLIEGHWAWFDLTGLSHRESGWLSPRSRLQCGPFTIRLHDDADRPAPAPHHQGTVRNERGNDYHLSFHNALQASSGPKSRRLRELVTIIGRVPPAHIRLAHPTVSRVHCLLVNTPRGLWLADLASTSGTFVNERLVDVAQLTPGDEIHIGDYDATLAGRDTQLSGPQPIDAPAAETGSDVDLPTVSAPTADWPAILPRLSDDDIDTPARSGPTTELTGTSDALLNTLLEHFSAMQREMMQQSQQQMMMMMQMFGQLQKTQLEAIRDDLQRVQEITRELCEVQAQFAAAQVKLPPAAQPPRQPPAHPEATGGAARLPEHPAWLPGLTPPAAADQEAEQTSRPRASHKDVSTHAQLAERIRVLERERNSRWQKIVSFLSTGS